MCVDTTYRDVRVTCKDGVLTVANGLIERQWRWTGKGFLTTRLASVSSQKVWTQAVSSIESDWLLPGYDTPQEAELLSVKSCVGDDEGFTSEHVAVVAEMAYAAAKIKLRFTVWIYPETPGMRTQLYVKGTQGYDSEAGDAVLMVSHRFDFIPVNFDGLRRRMFGYYNETQQRNDTCEDILKEESISHSLKNREFHAWPSVLCLENEQEGIALVNENHKCPNQFGYDCGLFICDADVGLSNHGWGLRANEIDDTWRQAWASWCIVYTQADRGCETALKRFDAARYPLDEGRDIYVQANTWGSSITGEESRLAAIESEVLKELESCADLGIDTLQIDDGWQVAPGHRSHNPEENGWHPHPESYPEGWTNVKKRSQELGVKLGLWAAAMPVSLEELKRNYQEGGFLTYKLDFADLKSNENIRALTQKVRDFIKCTGHAVRVNWDVTEVSRRYGYFFAREYGCLYLANRKPVSPPSTTYRPHTMLRDLWQLSRYINVRKIQGSIQNVDRVNQQLSDANQHPQDYCVAITLMGTPLFFQQTAYYTEEARKQIRPLLAVYKEHQKAIFRGAVYPVGSKPDNYSWAGFQSHNAVSNSGYLTIFRELNNEEPTFEMKLEFLAGRSLSITNLMDKKQRVVTVGADGMVEFAIEQAPGYLFLSYE